MHLAYYSPTWPADDAANGIATYVREMSREMKRRGHQVTVFTIDKVHYDDGRSIEMRPVGLIEKIQNKLGRQWAKWTSSARPYGAILAAQVTPHLEDVDLIEIEESFGWSKALNARAKTPLVVRLHGPTFIGDSSGISGRAAKLKAVRTADEGIGIRAAQFISSPAQRIIDQTLSFYCARPLYAKAIANPASSARDHISWSLNECVPGQILFVGRFDKPKGADLLLEAFTKLCETNLTASLVIAGPDTGIVASDGHIIHFEEYCDRFVNEAIARRITFLGRVSPERVAELRRASAVTVVCSRYECFPYSVVEAMAIGSPLVVFDGFGDGDMVVEGSTGWVVPNGDTSAMALAMADALANPQRAAQLGLAGMHRCNTRYGPTTIGAQMEAFYREVIALA